MKHKQKRERNTTFTTFFATLKLLLMAKKNNFSAKFKLELVTT